MDWLEVRVVTDETGAEAIAEALRPFAYQGGVAMEQLGDNSTADPNALETAVTVKAYLPEDADTAEKRLEIETAVAQLAHLFPLSAPSFHKLQEQDWANAWKAHYHPFRIGQRIWIQPSWLEANAVAATEMRADHIVLTLDPGMAFGTGLHATTQMCLRFLEQLVQPGQSVLDAGTGSGILAIAAVKLGATAVLAFDNDELAVKTAVANAELNGVLSTIKVQQSTLEQLAVQPWDIVVVNILAPVIISLLENGKLMSYVGQHGRLLLSGIINEQAEAIETAVRAAGGQVVDTLVISDWISFVVQHKDSVA